MTEQTNKASDAFCAPGQNQTSEQEILQRMQESSAEQSMAGPFSAEDFDNMLPADKKLNPEWLASLTERGQPQVFSAEKNELKYIGMPVGGIACGQLYLGGDGQLWYWGIFDSRTQSGYSSNIYLPNILGDHYRKPLTQDAHIPMDTWHVKQGFALQVKRSDAVTRRLLNSNGYQDIRFRGEYPLSKVYYQGGDEQVNVALEAFSPFCPLNVDDSSLPTTVLRYTVTNTGDSNAQVTLGGWLENAVCPLTAFSALGNRVTQTKEYAGNVSVVHTVTPRNQGEQAVKALISQSGYGSMVLSLLGEQDNTSGYAHILGDESYADDVFDIHGPNHAQAPILGDKPVGGLTSHTVELAAGESHTFTFVLSWHFANYAEKDAGEMETITGWGEIKREYARRFADAEVVDRYVIDNQTRLFEQTLAWNKTWYDSTLPYWLLDRAFIPLNALASQTMHRFDNGRWYGWEGVSCCPGTCQHVWHYAQGMARIFPEIEQSLREQVDFGVAWKESGEIKYRGEFHDQIAHDGLAGTIIRAYREHQTSEDSAYLKRIWPRVKQSVEFMISEDGEDSGILRGKQFNTLDAAWYGPMGWISSLYLGCLQAGKAMAEEMADEEFAERCQRILGAGKVNIVKELFNGEYFIHLPDLENHPTEINTNQGSFISQIMGQTYMKHLGLLDVIPKQETLSALQSLYKYNFAPDAGAYVMAMQEQVPGGRWFAMPGEAGLVMCTFPKGGADMAMGGRKGDLFAAYLNECMNGFEYDVASGMVWQDMVQEGLTCFRAVHDRYHASKRNPFNEVECGDHYSRSMASYGIFTAICGYEYHGPKGELAFAPKISPEQFKAPFTAANGWGSFSQSFNHGEQSNQLELAYGSLLLNTFSLALVGGSEPNSLHVSVNNQTINAKGQLTENGQYRITLNGLTLSKGDSLSVLMSY